MKLSIRARAYLQLHVQELWDALADHSPQSTFVARVKGIDERHAPGDPFSPHEDCRAPHIQNPDLFWMLLSCVRYAMGRRSTAPSTTCGWVKQYARFLEDSQLKQIKEEVETELRTCREFLGDECDHKEWQALVEFIEVRIG